MSGNLDPVLKTTGVLSRLWGLYLYQCNLGLPVFYARLNNHLKRVEESGEEKNISDYKGNLLKALDKDNMPWQRFCQGMGIVSPKGYTISFIYKIDKLIYEKDIVLGHCHREDMGTILSCVWKEVIETFPTRMDNWKELASEYAKNDPSSKTKKNTSLASNLKNVISKDSVTWRTFYTGMMVLNPDEFIIKVSDGKVVTKIKIKG